MKSTENPTTMMAAMLSGMTAALAVCLTEKTGEEIQTLLGAVQNEFERGPKEDLSKESLEIQREGLRKLL